MNTISKETLKISIIVRANFVKGIPLLKTQKFGTPVFYILK